MNKKTYTIPSFQEILEILPLNKHYTNLYGYFYEWISPFDYHPNYANYGVSAAHRILPMTLYYCQHYNSIPTNERKILDSEVNLLCLVAIFQNITRTHNGKDVTHGISASLKVLEEKLINKKLALLEQNPIDNYVIGINQVPMFAPTFLYVTGIHSATLENLPNVNDLNYEYDLVHNYFDDIFFNNERILFLANLAKDCALLDVSKRNNNGRDLLDEAVERKLFLQIDNETTNFSPYKRLFNLFKSYDAYSTDCTINTTTQQI